MGTVFQSISAELSAEFENLLSNNHARSFLERVCDLTGTLMISSSNNPLVAPNSLKICGSWASVSNAHNILSSYTIVRDLMKTDFDDNDNSWGEITSSEYLPTPKRRRKSRNRKICNLIRENDEFSSSMKLKTSPANPDILDVCPDSNTVSPIPVLLSSIGNTQTFPVNLSKQNEDIPGEPVPLTPEDGDMYFIENTNNQVTDFQNSDNQSTNTEEGGKGKYPCTLCKHYSTTSAKNLEAHLDRFHFKPVTCHICGRGFGYERDLKRHLLKNKYSCSTAKRSLINKHYVTITRSEYDTDEQSNSGVGNSIEDLVNLSKEGQDESCNDSNIHHEDLQAYSTKVFETEDSGFNLNLRIKEEPKELEEPNALEVIPIQSLSTNSTSPPKECTEALPSPIKQSRNLDSSTNSPEDEDERNDSYQDSTIQRAQMPPQDQLKLMEQEFGSSNFDFNVEEDFTTETTGEVTNYYCKICTYMAHKKQHMIDHICRMHKKQFACEHCNSMFGLVKDLNRHLRRTHGVDIPLKNSRGTIVKPLIPL